MATTPRKRTNRLIDIMAAAGSFGSRSARSRAVSGTSRWYRNGGRGVQRALTWAGRPASESFRACLSRISLRWVGVVCLRWFGPSAPPSKAMVADRRLDIARAVGGASRPPVSDWTSLQASSSRRCRFTQAGSKGLVRLASSRQDDFGIPQLDGPCPRLEDRRAAKPVLEGQTCGC